MSEKDYGELYVEYILGPLSEERAAELRRHLETCEECRRNVEELQETLHSIPLTLTPEAPPPELKERVLEQIGGRTRSEPLVRPFPAASPPETRFWKRWAIAATVLAGLSGLLATALYQSTQRQEGQLSFLESEVLRLRQSNQGLTLKIRELAGPDVRFLNLAGLSGFEGVAGSAFVLPDQRKAALYLHNLPTLAPNQAYQLWVIEPDTPPHPANVFQADGEVTEVEVDLPVPAAQVAVLAVTIEPAGGSPSPTGAMVAASKAG